MFSGDGREGINYTKHRAQCSTQLLDHHFRAFLWVPLGFMMPFLCSSAFKVACVSSSSTELPWFKNTIHGNLRVFFMLLNETCGALIFIFLGFAFQIKSSYTLFWKCLSNFAFCLDPNMGAFVLNYQISNYFMGTSSSEF